MIKVDLLTISVALPLLVTPLQLGADDTASDSLNPKNFKASDFDSEKLGGNANGRIEFPEFIRFQIKKRNPRFNDLDRNHDATICEAEKSSWAEEFGWDVGFPDATSIDFPTADTTIPPPKPSKFFLGKPEKGIGQMRLRKNHADLIKPLDNAAPASFGYYNNQGENTDTWAAQAAVGFVRNILSPNATIVGYELDPIQFVPSVEVNRVTGVGDGGLKEVDALVFRTGFSSGLRDDGQDGLFDYELFNINYRRAGTTGGGDFKDAMEVEWEPMRNRNTDTFSLNGPYRPGLSLGGDNSEPLFFYRLTSTARLEAGQEIDPSHDGMFVKLGPQVGIVLQPSGLQRLELYGQFTYLLELANESRDFDNLEAGLRYAVDPNKQMFLELKYRNGQVPAKYTPVDLWQAALAVKF